MDGLLQDLRESRDSAAVTKASCTLAGNQILIVKYNLTMRKFVQSKRIGINLLGYRSAGYYQNAPANPITFAMTKREKEAKKRTEVAEGRVGEEHIISTPKLTGIAQKLDALLTSESYNAVAMA